MVATRFPCSIFFLQYFSLSKDRLTFRGPEVSGERGREYVLIYWELAVFHYFFHYYYSNIQPHGHFSWHIYSFFSFRVPYTYIHSVPLSTLLPRLLA